MQVKVLKESILGLSVALFVGSAFLTGCNAISVNYDYDPEADFTKLNTYSWLAVSQELQINELIIKRVKNAVNRQLHNKGFKILQDKPDFLIAMRIGKESKREVVDWGYSSRNWHGSRVDVYEYEEGTLILDFVDAGRNELIWQGSARAVVEPDITPQKRDKRINEAVAKILKNFPPNSSK